MAHSLEAAEAVDVSEGFDLDDAAAAIGNIDLGDEDDQLEDDEPEGDEPDDEPDDSDDDEQDDDEPEAAIEAPASLNAEEKAQFAQLPKEAQRLIAEVETRRNGQVQQATTKASEAQRQAESRAAQADAQAKAIYAQQLDQFVSQFAPQRPDPRLAQTDPATFIAMNAQYEAQAAQHQDLMQQIKAVGAEAAQQMTETEIAERNRGLMSFPEVQNEETRAVFFEKAELAAKRIGLDIGEVGQRASAQELKALRDIADAFEKADKYDAAKSKQMQRVRDAKKTSGAKPNASQSNGRQKGFQAARERLRSSGSIEDAAAAIGRLG